MFSYVFRVFKSFEIVFVPFGEERDILDDLLDREESLYDSHIIHDLSKFFLRRHNIQQGINTMRMYKS